jgi:hypothetical protein
LGSVVGPVAGEDSRAYENLSLDPENRDCAVA